MPAYYFRKLDEQKIFRIKLKRLQKEMKIAKTRSPLHIEAVAQKLIALRKLYQRDDL